jgi:aminocarboxymuconate-semialdehyde decarboxylase
MIIDFHSHLNPKEWSFWGRKHPSMFDVEGLIEAQEQAGIDISVTSNPLFGKPPELNLTSLDALKIYHDFAAEIAAKFPGRIVPMACAVPFEDGEFIKETERALDECGCKGVLINSSVQGEYLDSGKAHPFFELVTARDFVVFVHPPFETVGSEKMEKHRLVEMVGRPFDTTLSIARFILDGGFARFPRLKLVLAHVGGAITMLPGRLNHGYELRHIPHFGPWEPDILEHPPSFYIKKLYVDTMGFHPPAVLCALATLGANHVLLGSDFPPVCVPLKRSVDLVENLPLSPKDKTAILGGNAARLLKLG